MRIKGSTYWRFCYIPWRPPRRDGAAVYPGGGEQGQSVGMDFNQGTKFNVVSSALDLNATSQAKHCLWVPQQDQSRGAVEEEVLRKKEQGGSR